VASSFVTPEGALSYPKLFKSELPYNAKPTDKNKWSTSLVFDKDKAATPEFKALLTAAVATAREKWGADVSDKIQFDAKGMAFVQFGKQTLRMPFRNDTANKGYPEPFVYYISASKTDDPNKNIITPRVFNRNGTVLTDTKEIYNGAKARISVHPFSYDVGGNKGVAFGLNNVQKMADGPRFDSNKNAGDEFDKLDDLPAADLPGGEPSLSAMLG
jgi:hypothetical protein